MPSTAYTIERFESRFLGIGPLRFGWRIRAANSQIILSSTSQGYSRRIDREDVIRHFFEKGIQGQSVGFESDA